MPKPAPANATPEQLATWRKEQGLPESPEGYVSGLKLSEGVIPGEADKPAIEAFAKVALEKGMSQDAVNTAVDFYFAQQQAAAAAREAQDATFHDDAVQTLTQEWGQEYKRNQTAIGNLMARFAPEGVGDQILSARLPDGSVLGDNPGALRFLVAAARNAFPAATVVDPSTPNPGQAIANEIASLEKLMGDQRSEYWRGPNAERMQARYRDLVAAQQASASRAA